MIIEKLSRKLRDDLEPSYVFKGYYRHPVYRDLFVDALGDCKVKGMVMPLPVFILKSGYLGVRGCKGETHLHRIVATVFLDKCGDEVNHRDGVKSNPSVVNLEWCYRMENVNHAFDTGLRTDNIIVDVRNLETGDIVQFRSMTKAAEYIGVNRHLVSSSIARGLNRQYTLNDVFEVKVPEDDWILTKNSIGKNSGPGNKGLVIRKVGKEPYFLFSSVPAAAEYVGIKPHLIYSHLNGGSVDLTKFGYEAWYMVDIDVAITDMIDLRKPRPQSQMPKRVPSMVRVTDTTTNIKTIWNSLQEFSNAIGVKRNTVAKAVSQTGKYKQFEVQYLTAE